MAGRTLGSLYRMISTERDRLKVVDGYQSLDFLVQYEALHLSLRDLTHVDRHLLGNRSQLHLSLEINICKGDV
jgi:hypothetical protein